MQGKKSIILILLLLSGAIFLMGLSFFLDAPVRARILQAEGMDWDHSAKRQFFNAISRYGDWPELMLLGALGVGIARQCHSRRWQEIFVMAMVASTLAGALTNTLRLTTGRTRPRVSPQSEQAWYGPYHNGEWTVGYAPWNSFPSGHTATAFGFAIVIFLASPMWGLLALLIAALIASSRLILGAHHPSDLVGAIFIASGVIWLLSNSRIQRLCIMNSPCLAKRYSSQKRS